MKAGQVFIRTCLNGCYGDSSTDEFTLIYRRERNGGRHWFTSNGFHYWWNRGGHISTALGNGTPFPIEHPSADGLYGTPREAEAALEAFLSLPHGDCPAVG